MAQKRAQERNFVKVVMKKRGGGFNERWEIVADVK